MTDACQKIIHKIESCLPKETACIKELCIELKKCASELHDMTALGYAYLIYGQTELRQGKNTPHSIKHLIQALKYLEKEKSYEYMVACYRLLGLAFLCSQDYLTALDYLLQGIQLLDLHDFPKYRALIYNHIGEVYDHFEDYARSEEYYQMSLELDQKNDYQYTSCRSLFHLAYVEAKLGKYREALTHAVNGINVMRLQHSDYAFSCYAYSILASVYHMWGNRDRAYSYFYIAERYVKECSKYSLDFFVYLEYPAMLIEDQRYQEAAKQLEILYPMHQNLNWHDTCAKICNYAITTYQALGDDERLFEYYKLYYFHTQQEFQNVIKLENICLEASELCRQLKKSNDALERLSNTDSLTGLANKRRLFSYMEALMSQCKRSNTSLGIIIFDIDNFKRLNDTYGHLTGDECLRQIGAALKRFTKDTNFFAARFGGDEMVLVTSDCSMTAIETIASSIRRLISEISIDALLADNLHLSISTGIYTAVPNGYDSILDFIQQADRKLYLNKKSLKH